ncbi:MAG TPA: helix-turn-helix domain-containing protein, partial [Aeromicrobium sp.]|nr:helix-turn-helix domain-containing protein [Aeromicrobium sp.]
DPNVEASAWDLDAWVGAYVADASSDANVEKFVQAVDSAILEQIPEIAENARLSEELHASTKSQWRSFLTVLERENPDLLLPPQAVDIAVSMARRGMDVGILLKVYRVAADATWEFLVGVADAVPDDGPERADVLKFLWGRASRWISDSIDRLVLTYFTEREAVFEGAFARRNETVQSLLRGDSIPVDTAAKDLGHPIRAQQTCLVLWFNDAAADGSSTDLEAIAQAIAREVTAPRPLTVAPGSRELWVWLATRQAPDMAGLPAIVERYGARAAIGGPSPGLAGFRTSHREAVDAQRLVLRAGTGSAVTTYADVELACLMSEQPEAAQQLIERELGKLAEPDPALDIVRATLSHYLRNGSNIVLTASELFVHRNTVRYRLDQAEELVGHPLTERRTEMDVALRLVTAGLGR